MKGNAAIREGGRGGGGSRESREGLKLALKHTVGDTYILSPGIRLITFVGAFCLNDLVMSFRRGSYVRSNELRGGEYFSR